MLLAAAAALLGWSSRSHQNASASLSSTLGFFSTHQATSRGPVPPRRAKALLAGLPLIFEPNQGQAYLDPDDSRARFLARGSGYGLYLGSEGATLTLTSHKSAQVETLQMKLAGANPRATLHGAELLPGKSNYFLGNDRSRWRHNIPQFAGARYENIYPGIDLVFYGNQGRLEYDFQVAPGSDPSQAELEFHGAKQMELKDGALILHGENGNVRLEAPSVYQQIAGRREPVDGAFVLRSANRVGFRVGAYDHSRELVIDPVLTFATYFGGTGDETSTYVAVDSATNIYLTGSTTSPSLPGNSAGVKQPNPGAPGAQNAYIVKINPNVTGAGALVYVTYLGGSGPDIPSGIEVDGGGDPFIAGTTFSPAGNPYPTSPSAYQRAPLPGSTGTKHAFVSALKSDFSDFIYSSYLSGNGNDEATGMAIDTGGNIYVTGDTTSNNAGDSVNHIQFPASTLPEALAFQPLPATSPQFFVTKVNTQAPESASISYSTYFGGAISNSTTPIAQGGGVAVDTNGNIYFTGTTNFTYTGCAGCASTDFPIKNAYQPCLDQTAPTSYVPPFLCTTTTSANTDAFVAKINPNVTGGGTGQLQWSTYLGGTQNDVGNGIAVDSGAANVYVVGTTNSTDITTTLTFGAYQPCLDAPGAAAGSCPTGLTANDAFIAKLSNPASTGTTTNGALTYFSYLGGSGDEAGQAVTVDTASGAIITGLTKSAADFPVFPTSNDIQGTYGGGPQDAFLARINTAAASSGQNSTGSWATYYGGSGSDQGTGVALDSTQNIYFAGNTNSTNLHVNAVQTTNAGGFDAFVGQVQSAASLTITGSLSTTQPYISAGNEATFTYTLTNLGPDLANDIVITDNIGSNQTGIPVTFVSASATSGTCSGGSSSTNISCSIQSLQSGSTATITIVLTPTPNAQGGSQQFNGGAVSATASDNITVAPIFVSANMSDFSVTVNPQIATVPAAGDPASYTVQLTPHPVYSSSIGLSCSGLPTGATCTFSPTPVTLVGISPATATLTISTTARPITTPAASLFTGHFYAVWLSFPGLALFGFGGSKARRRVAGVISLCVLGFLLALQPACSHSTTQPAVSGTPPGHWPIVVTATSGSDAKSQGISLWVP